MYLCSASFFPYSFIGPLFNSCLSVLSPTTFPSFFPLFLLFPLFSPSSLLSRFSLTFFSPSFLCCISIAEFRSYLPLLYPPSWLFPSKCCPYHISSILSLPWWHFLRSPFLFWLLLSFMSVVPLPLRKLLIPPSSPIFLSTLLCLHCTYSTFSFK